jgi:hypothetical protein
MKQHDMCFDDKFRDAGAVPEVKTSDEVQGNRADLTRKMMALLSRSPLRLKYEIYVFSIKTEIARSTNGTSCRMSERLS